MVRVNGGELKEVHPTAIDYALETSPAIHPSKPRWHQGIVESRTIFIDQEMLMRLRLLPLSILRKSMEIHSLLALLAMRRRLRS